ncbi:hypothetical protein [Rubritalea tangerina]|uniref:Outer membrane protein beta-barrel domain-containing protein n=1 Tax=Rubritalea tangerina TaxID=430798 RepID=A0ABW4ZAV4_9BACT
MKKHLFACALAATLSSTTYAIERAPLQTGYIYDFATDVDGGGEISKNFFHLTGGIPLTNPDSDFFVALSASYHYHGYDFKSGPVGSFTSLSPWDDVHTGNLGLFMRYKYDEKWDFFAIPNIRTSGESGASFSDTLTGGILAGASYTFSDTLTIGPGIGVVGQLEDSASVFPILVIDWQFCENMSLTTGSTVGASLGPGLAVKWDINDNLRFTLGARSERLRFRLDDSNVLLKDAIGEDNSIPVFGILTWQATNNIQTSLIAGVGFANDLVLDDSQGNRILRKDYDNAPFLGVNLGYTF